jgi:hypothetical protein
VRVELVLFYAGNAFLALKLLHETVCYWAKQNSLKTLISVCLLVMQFLFVCSIKLRHNRGMSAKAYVQIIARFNEIK